MLHARYSGQSSILGDFLVYRKINLSNFTDLLKLFLSYFFILPDS